MNFTKFRLLWWSILVVNFGLVGAALYVIYHFLQKFW